MLLLNYLKVSLRHLLRDRSYALINIFGLALGIACFVVLALYLEFELSYDRHFDNHQNIYRLVNEIETGGRTELTAVSSRLVGATLAEDYPEVLDFVRFEMLPVRRQILRHENTVYYWDDVLAADANVFQVFSHQVLEGDPVTALENPTSIAISQTMAQRYFGDEPAVGKTLSTNTGAYQVTLVFADLPENTHLRYSALISYNRILAFGLIPNLTEALWGVSAYTYLVLPEHYDPADFARIGEDFYQRYQAERGHELSSRMRYHLQPLASIHLNSTAHYDQPTGSKFYVYAFATIAFFVLAIACINYMNLATARATKRAREIGMRKVVGAGRRQLINQFLGESLIYSCIALLIAVIVVHLVLAHTPISQLLGRQLSLDLLARPGLALALLGLAALVGLISGLYPALYLSAIPPNAAFRGDGSGRASGSLARQILVFAQFSISVGVVSAAVLMALQMHYIQSKPLGFDKDNLLVVRLQTANLIERIPYIKADLAQHSRILGVTGAQFAAGEEVGLSLVQIDNHEGVMEPHSLNIMGFDEDFLAVMGIELVAGRNFGPDTPRDFSVIVNKTLVREMGWEDPIGKRIHSGNYRNQVVGVMRDFHFHSLHQPVSALFAYGYEEDLSFLNPMSRLLASRTLLIKIAPHDISETLAFLRERWLDYAPGQPFDYRFYDDMLNAVYLSERQQMQLIAIFAGVCILLSCMGLFGLSSFTTAQRTKEIGIRKILGASTFSVVILLFQRIAGLILIGALVGSVVCYYLMAQWLAGFAYRQEINPLIFVLATLGALAVAFITVALQSWRTASSSPALALKYE